MLIRRTVSTIAVAGLATVLAGACSSSSSSSSSSTTASPTTAVTGDKTAFRADNATLDKAFFSVSSADGAVAAAKANQTAITDFAKTLAADIKAQADVLVAASNAAVAANDGTKFQTASAQTAGTAVDAYCGQMTDGEAIPAYAGAGNGTGFCADQAAIDQALSSAQDAASLLAALQSVKAKVDDFANNIPAAVQTEAQALVTAARAALAANDATSLTTPAIQADSLHVDSYCAIPSASSSSPSTTVASSPSTTA